MSKENTYLKDLKNKYKIEDKPKKIRERKTTNSVGKIDPSLKVNKVGKLHKANRAVKTRQKIEAVENKLFFKIDRADKQRNERRAKRRK